MKNATYIAIGILLVLLTSATTVSIMTVKPAQPVDTAVVVGSPAKLQASILNLAKRGYVVKSVSVGAKDYYDGIAVLEKY
jgi:hypothetical protein